MVELTFISKKEYKDPFNEVDLSFIITGPDKSERTVPAFWAGGNKWRIRYSSPSIGIHSYKSIFFGMFCYDRC
jgi:hypothetical protein